MSTHPEYWQRLKAAWAQVRELSQRPADPSERLLPVSVADRCRRAARALKASETAMRTVRPDVQRALRTLNDAEHELRLAGQLVASLEAPA